MRKVLAAITRALRAMLSRFSAVMRRLLGLPDPGPDVEEVEIPDVGLDAVTQSDAGEAYSEIRVEKLIGLIATNPLLAAMFRYRPFNVVELLSSSTWKRT